MKASFPVRTCAVVALAVAFSPLARAIPNPESVENAARRDSPVAIRFAITEVRYSQSNGVLQVLAVGFVKDTIVRQPHGLLVGDEIVVAYPVQPMRNDSVAAQDFKAKRPGTAPQLPIPVLRVGDVADGWFGRRDDGTLYPSAGQYSFEFIGRQQPILIRVGETARLQEGDLLQIEEIGTLLRVARACTGSECGDGLSLTLEIINDLRYQQVELTPANFGFRISDKLSIAVSDWGASGVYLRIVPTSEWTIGESRPVPNLPTDWIEQLGRTSNDYVEHATLQEETLVIEQGDERLLVRRYATGNQLTGSENASLRQDLFAYYDTRDATWSKLPLIIKTRYSGRSGGCFSVEASHTFAADVDFDGDVEIGFLNEELHCSYRFDETEELDRPYRVHRRGSLRWYDYDERGEWYQVESASNSCPPGKIVLLPGPGEDAIQLALERNPQVDEHQLSTPHCVEKALENGFYTPVPALDGDLFVFDHINFSRGFSHYGLMVDRHGQVFALSAFLPIDRKDAEQAELETRFDVIGPPLGMIKGVRQYSGYARRMQDAGAPPDAGEVQCCDMGTSTYSVLMYNPRMKRHREIQLAQKGAMEWQVSDSYAEKIVGWLMELQPLIRPAR